MEGIKMGDHSHSEGCKALDLAYQRAGESYEAITEFRGKLLALLPLATGTAAFLLLERVQAAQAQAAQAQAAQAQAAQAQAAQALAHAHQLQQFLGPIGIFGVVVTLGLFTYELRGMQRCHRLEVQAGALEKQLGLSAEQGPFLGQPQRALGNMLGPPAAGLIIYLATAFAWLWLAGYGLGWWAVRASGLLYVYGAVLLVAWILLSWWLRRSAIGGLPKKWKKRRVDLPPLRPNWRSDEDIIAAKNFARLITDNKRVNERERNAMLDGAETEYLNKLGKTFSQCRITAAERSRQGGQTWRIWQRPSARRQRYSVTR
jgi:hypothetical protein